MDNGVWRTIGGRRIFIKNGKDIASAVRESGKFRTKKKKEADSKKTEKLNKSTQGKEYRNKLKSLDGKEDGTYNLDTGKAVDFGNKGYNVSFEQSSDKYDDAEYFDKITECRNKCDGNVYGGVFGGDPEISFYTTDLKTAKEIMYKYNQHSIWSNELGDIIMNDRYNENKNKVNYKGE